MNKLQAGILFFTLLLSLQTNAAGAAIPHAFLAKSTQPLPLGPEWTYENNRIGVEFECKHSENFIGFPKLSCTPYLTFSGETGNYIKVGNFTLLSKTFSSSSASAIDIYRELSLKSDPIIQINQRRTTSENLIGTSSTSTSVRIYEFHRHAERFISSMRDYHEKIYSEDRNTWIIKALSWIILTPLSLFLGWSLIQKAYPYTRTIKTHTKKSIKAIRGKIFDIRVRRTAIDETVRQITRQKIAESGSDQQKIILEHIQLALEKGDIETAKTLSETFGEIHKQKHN